jgi:N-acetylmuramoyl-L-alanine amidase CwlA
MISITRAILTNPRSRPALKDPAVYAIKDVRAIIAHWTANIDRGAHAMANRNYFNLGLRAASAHYCVDDSSIVQCLPDNEVGYHVGAKKYKPQGKQVMRGFKTPNYTTVGFEMCVNADGNWAKTYANSVHLAAWLLYKHGLSPEKDLFRHHDITGKDCPKMMLEPKAWIEFTARVQDQYNELKALYVCSVNSESLNVRMAPSAISAVKYELAQREKVVVFERLENGWCRIGADEWVNGRFLNVLFKW